MYTLTRERDQLQYDNNNKTNNVLDSHIGRMIVTYRHNILQIEHKQFQWNTQQLKLFSLHACVLASVGQMNSFWHLILFEQDKYT